MTNEHVVRAAKARPLEGKVALVTGASSGIGRGIAERLAADGARVAINYRHGRDGAEAAEQTIRAGGGEAALVQGDVSNDADVARMFAFVAETFGTPDILVNNAGRGTMQPLAETTDAIFDEIYGLNVKGVLHGLKHAALNLADEGRVINIGSTTAVYPWPGTAIYASSKAAVLKLTEIAAIELGQRRITVNSVIPGITETPMTTALPKEATAPVAEASPYKRLGTPADIAAVVAWLASPDALWVTGQQIVANGGSGH
jgi:3-oxoacyl-[acyl-carrier protein] reductase